MEERLQKIISAAGLASRREAERLILGGRVTVNGVEPKKLGQKADPERDEIRLDGKLVNVVLGPLYVLVHKPEGFVTTTKDPEGRPTVMDLVKRIKQRVYPVGRLDYATSGLLLITSDGEMTKFLTHPSSNIKKTYMVKVKGKLSREKIDELRKGPKIGGNPLKPSLVKFVKPSKGGGRHSWFEMTITEGRTRQIRKMCEAVGHPVMKLKRVSVGPLKLGPLPVGDFRFLSEKEVADLKKLIKKPPKKKPAARKKIITKKK